MAKTLTGHLKHGYGKEGILINVNYTLAMSGGSFEASLMLEWAKYSYQMH